jgi:glucan phosphoethanolaminetransferase (alkaline phosphatase superfamily)
LANFTEMGSIFVNKSSFYLNKTNGIIENMQNLIPCNILAWICVILVIILIITILIIKFKNNVDYGITIISVVLIGIVILVVLYLFFKDSFLSFFS